jgi:putative peptide maturation dehydrogenase
MENVRRSRYALYYCGDSGLLDVAQLLRGTVEIKPHQELFGVSILTGDERPLDLRDLELLLRLPADRWLALDDLEQAASQRILDLARAGLVVTDESTGPLADLRRRDDRLAANRWHPYAALFHLALRQDAVDREPLSGEQPAEAGEGLVATALEHLAAEGRAPPSHFHSHPHLRRADLPLARRAGGLYDVLSRRHTTRGFDATGTLSAEQLATVLHYGFGCHGLLPVSPHLTLMRKTSPSGGALHPIEVYAVVASGSGVATGLYHYSVEGHALEEIAALTEEEARALADAFTGGQPDWSGASALFVLSARFYRTFWKYGHDPRAYAVLLLDAGHLSQTFQLVCADLGLGAFVTAAIDAAEIEERLGLDPAEEGAIAICGCGVPAPERSELEPRFEPYTPPRSRSSG